MNDCARLRSTVVVAVDCGRLYTFVHVCARLMFVHICARLCTFSRDCARLWTFVSVVVVRLRTLHNSWRLCTFERMWV